MWFYLASFYMFGQALTWFQWMLQNQQLFTWPALAKSLGQRFGPSSLINPQTTLFKLRQTTTVEEYQSLFENTSNSITNLPPDVVLNYFISGLKTHIKNELLLLRPNSISDAIELAKLVKSKLNDNRPTSFAAIVTATTHHPFTPYHLFHRHPKPIAKTT